MKKGIATGFMCAMILFLSIFVSFVDAAPKVDSPATIAILPFSMHTPSDLAYLQQGIRDMLASRLAWQGKVNVVERSLTEQAIHGVKSDLSLSEAAKIGSTLKADYVLFGSVTALGQSISIDAKVAAVAGGSEPLSLYAQTKTLDEVIPRINQFAQDINHQVFSRSTETADASTPDSDFSTTRNPELLVPDVMKSSDRISYVNPNFLEVTPEGSLRQPGLWRSQTFKGGIVGMDMGDLDGDGRLEMVAITNDKLMVMRREAYALKTIATFNASKMDRFLWVSLADLDRDKKDEIYLSSMKRFNQPGGNSYGQHINYGKDTIWDTSSFVLTLAGKDLQVMSKDNLFFLNAIDLPKRGRVLLGQQKDDERDGTFKPEISEMQLKGGRVVPLSSMALPSRCNVFNFTKADLNNDGSEETILTDSQNRMLVLDPAGNQVWKSRHWFGATSNYFTGKITDLRYNQVDYFYLPSPILVTDLNKDDVKEIIANRCPDYNRFLPEGVRYYESGEVVSLSWDQMGLIENWKTRDINGMVTSLRVGDLNGDGVPELVATLVVAKDWLKLWESQSTIFSYDLNISQTQTARKP